VQDREWQRIIEAQIPRKTSYIRAPRRTRPAVNLRTHRGIYFILQEHTPALQYVKIGLYTDLQDRMSQIQNGSPVPLKLLGTIARPVTIEDERAIHNAFRHTHCHLEWFRASHGLFEYIRDNATDVHPYVHRWLAKDRTRRVLVDASAVRPINGQSLEGLLSSLPQ